MTLKEHWEVHLLRLEAYQQAGDAYMFFFCWKKLPKEFKDRLVNIPIAYSILEPVIIADSL